MLFDNELATFLMKNDHETGGKRPKGPEPELEPEPEPEPEPEQERAEPELKPEPEPPHQSPLQRLPKQHLISLETRRERGLLMKTFEGRFVDERTFGVFSLQSSLSEAKSVCDTHPRNPKPRPEPQPTLCAPPSQKRKPEPKPKPLQSPPPPTRVKWAPFVLLAFLPLFYSIFCFKIGHFPLKLGSLKIPFSGPKRTNGGFGDSKTPKPPEMPIKLGKTSQHHNWPRYLD